MNYPSPSVATSFALSMSLLLAACGGGSGGTKPSSAASVPSSVKSSLAASSISSSTVSSTAATSRSSIATASCTLNGKSWPVCTTDTGNWSYEAGQYCISHSFCPANRTLPTARLKTAPVDAAADAKAKAVYSYLTSIWGSKTLSGQQDLTWKDSINMAERVHNDTGKYPALMGFDFMNYGMTANWVEGRHQTEEAIAYSQKGGLVAFSWHWRDPALLDTADVNNAKFYVTQSQASENTSFTIPVKADALDSSSNAYTQINAGIDLIAAELKTLSDANVPVLWRPLHEASGNDGNGWFWWGRKRADGVPQSFAQILLWRHMYDRLVNYHGLHNLIWVWNGQDPAWYPGDAYVDIVSHDIYDSSDNKTYKSQIQTYARAAAYPFETKMVALSENSYIPDPDKMSTDNAGWLWFMVWNDSDTAEGITDSGNFWTGEYYNTNAHKTKVYSHANVITLDELPDFNQ